MYVQSVHMYVTCMYASAALPSLSLSMAAIVSRARPMDSSIGVIDAKRGFVNSSFCTSALESN